MEITHTSPKEQMSLASPKHFRTGEEKNNFKYWIMQIGKRSPKVVFSIFPFGSKEKSKARCLDTGNINK